MDIPPKSQIRFFSMIRSTSDSGYFGGLEFEEILVTVVNRCKVISKKKRLKMF